MFIEKKKEKWSLPQVAEKSLQDFTNFRDRYFMTETGDAYETPEFHKKWIEEIMNAKAIKEHSSPLSGKNLPFSSLSEQLDDKKNKKDTD